MINKLLETCVVSKFSMHIHHVQVPAILVSLAVILQRPCLRLASHCLQPKSRMLALEPRDLNVQKALDRISDIYDNESRLERRLAAALSLPISTESALVGYESLRYLRNLRSVEYCKLADTRAELAIRKLIRSRNGNQSYAVARIRHLIAQHEARHAKAVSLLVKARKSAAMGRDFQQSKRFHCEQIAALLGYYYQIGLKDAKDLCDWLRHKVACFKYHICGETEPQRFVSNLMMLNDYCN